MIERKKSQSKSLVKLVQKAVERADWYKMNFRASNNFEKKFFENFEKVLDKFFKTHWAEKEAIFLMESQFPEVFRQFVGGKKKCPYKGFGRYRYMNDMTDKDENKLL
jgi:hypothetical protein